MSARIITATNVNGALTDGLWHLRTCGYKEDSRNGPVIVAPGPVITQYLRPVERLVSHPERDANHVFHLMETIWMLAGRRHVGWLLPFNARFAEYAEGNLLQHGAYGHRWRHLFGLDQVWEAVAQLRKPNNRRVVIGMWHPMHDLGTDARDVPCNTHIYLQVLRGHLEMTVCCRSNDVIWGAYGANAVHFSFLQELIATALGVDVGTYTQFSNNFHLYTELGQGAALLQNPPSGDKYATGEWKAISVLQPLEPLADFLTDCATFVSDEGQDAEYKTAFMREVANPLRIAYLARKAGEQWVGMLSAIPDCDWKSAFIEWAARREEKQ